MTDPPADGVAGAPNEPLCFGELVIDRAGRRVTVAGERIELPRMELDLLVLLAEGVDHVFSRDELLRAVWKSRPE